MCLLLHPNPLRTSCYVPTLKPYSSEIHLFEKKKKKKKKKIIIKVKRLRESYLFLKNSAKDKISFYFYHKITCLKGDLSSLKF